MSDLSIQVAVADDHPVVLLGVAMELERNPSLRIIGQANDSTELVALLDQHPATQVLDYNMPGGRYGDGLVLLSHLRRRYRELRLVLYTMVDNPALLLAIVKQGTSGVVSKSDSLTHLVDAVHAAHGGRQYYSPTIKDMLLNSMMVAEQQADAARGRNRPAVLRRQHHHRNRRAAAPQRADRQYQKRSAMRKLGVSRDVDLIKMYTGGV